MEDTVTFIPKATCYLVAFSLLLERILDDYMEIIPPDSNISKNN